MADQFTEAELKVMYPRTPRLWPSLVEKPELSNDPRRAAAQAQYPNSPSMWPAEQDLGAELAKLEKLREETAKQYPNSWPAMIRHEVVASQTRVIQEMAEDQKVIDSMKAELGT